MEAKVEALKATLAKTKDLLRQYGDRWIVERLDELETRLAREDWTAIKSAVSEATGSMGSLRDRWLSAANGDAITREEEPLVNARLSALVEEVEQRATDAAKAVGLELFR